MKQKKLIAVLILASSLLLGCESDPEYVSSVESSSESTSVDNHIYDFDPNDAIQKGGSYGGFFTEIGVNRKLTTGRSFEFSFASSSIRKNYTITSSNEDVATITHSSNTSQSFMVNAISEGDFILELYNYDEVLVFRNIVHVVKPYTPEEMPAALFNVDVFSTPKGYEAYLGNWDLVFTSENPCTGSLKGKDDLESSTFVFSLEYESTLESIDAYAFKVTTISSNSSYTTLAYLDITRALDYVYVYETGGLVTMLCIPAAE